MRPESQDVACVTHRDTIEDRMRLGREVERRVIARAVRWHLQDRVLVDGNQAVIFDRDPRGTARSV